MCIYILFGYTGEFWGVINKCLRRPFILQHMSILYSYFPREKWYPTRLFGLIWPSLQRNSIANIQHNVTWQSVYHLQSLTNSVWFNGLWPSPHKGKKPFFHFIWPKTPEQSTDWHWTNCECLQLEITKNTWNYFHYICYNILLHLVSGLLCAVAGTWIPS